MIGLSIDKTSETHSTVNIRIGIHERIKNMNETVKDPDSVRDPFGYYEKLEDQKKDIKILTDKVEKSQRGSNDYFNGMINEMINQ